MHNESRLMHALTYLSVIGGQLLRRHCGLFTVPIRSAAEQRFANPPNEARLAELESLRDFLKETLSLLDRRTQEIAAPAERLKALLMSKDKKAAILEMAGMFGHGYCMQHVRH